MSDRKRIQQLPTLLANQIAAGEVIERPSSVLKELLENSIDAKSTQIDITIEKGGIGLIQVQDDGVGIYQEDLALAILPHATSKIATLADLENVGSFGFRGEALASISAVSRLELSSWVPEQEFGWSVSLAGRDVAPNLKPVPKRKGSMVVVRDLFYNTPARRKFLRSEKTENTYIEEVFKRIALSQPEIAFKFQRGEGIQKRLAVCRTLEAHTRRVAAVCGQSFVDGSYYLEAEANGLTLKGWLGSKKALRAQADVQYFYVNGRIVRDKVVMHAVRQAYQDICEPGRYPAYVLYFELDPAAVDVNVHPTKHEVRFREARTVHAFLSYAIQEGLKKGEGGGIAESGGSKQKTDFSFLDIERDSFSEEKPEKTESTRSKTSFKSPLSVFNGEIVWVQNMDTVSVVDVYKARSVFIRHALKTAYQAEGASKRSLLMPKSIILGKIDNIDSGAIDWDRLGFDVTVGGNNLLLIRSVPMVLGSKIDDLHTFLSTLFTKPDLDGSIQYIAEYIVKNQPLSDEGLKEFLREVGLEVNKGNKEYSQFCKTFTIEALRRALF